MNDDPAIREAEGTSGTPGGGRYVMMRAAVQGSDILEASYRCNGCAYAHQLARGASAFLKNRTVDQALELDANDILTLFGPVPEGKEYYAQMIIDALKSALERLSDLPIQPTTPSHQISPSL